MFSPRWAFLALASALSFACGKDAPTEAKTTASEPPVEETIEDGATIVRLGAARDGQDSPATVDAVLGEIQRVLLATGRR